MKRPITRLFAVLALTVSMTAAAQVPLQPCATYEAMEEVFKNDPAARQNYEAVQAILNQQTATMPAGKSAAFEYTIPVVFHVLHTGGAENLSDASIEQALEWVNKDFESTHADKNTVAQPFQGMMIDADIKLVLAHKDPQGNGTTGIIHHYDSRTVWNRTNNLNFNSPLYAGITWPATRYLNIILVKEIVAQAGQVGIVVGYTFKPGNFGNNDTRDAVVMTAGYMNSIMNVRSLSHEIGHWLNLSHTFGDTNTPGTQCGDDFVCDTPPHMGDPNMQCQNSGAGNVCATTGTCGWSAGQQNTENIMNYATCSKNFTQGQVDRMRATLASNVSGRSNLSQPANLNLTGIDLTGPFPPMADFASTTDSYTVCAGSSLTFKDYSFNGVVTGYQWSAGGAGGIITNETSSVSTIMFPVTGTVDVNLAVSNNLGTHVKTKIITVLEGNPQLVGPLNESFELGALPQDWKVVNGNANTTTWKPTFTAAFDGSGSFMLEGGLSGASHQDVLYTPIIDMANSPVKEITFAYAYAHKNGSTATFSVQATGDCGGSWSNLYVQSANQLSYGSGGNMNSAFTPTSASQWKTVALSTAGAWSGLKDSPHLTIRFVFTEGTAGNGNNFYLDAVTLPIPDGLEELKNSVGFNMFPNPTDGKVDFQFNLTKSSDVQIAVTDLTGRRLLSVADQKLEAGQHKLELNAGSTLSNGVYLVDIQVNGLRMSEKLIVR